MNCHHCRSGCHAQSVSPKHRWRWLWRVPQTAANPLPSPTLPTIALVGSPNVGKSVLFHALTGTYVTVSNYPGTTVEITQGQATIGTQDFQVIDTPGMYSLLPITEEERVTRDLLIHWPITLVIHVVDAKNLGRMLPLTLQLLEAGLPVLLVLNMIDEAQQLRLDIHPDVLERELGIPIVLTAAAQNRGIAELKARIANYVSARRVPTPH
ncbi:FeoB small GTPase domain-containing protein [Trichothermofontia sp.]